MTGGGGLVAAAPVTTHLHSDGLPPKSRRTVISI